MAIVVRLDELLHARRMTLTELAARIDITVANLSILKTGKAKAVRLSRLEAICTALEYQPGELLAFALQPAQDWTLQAGYGECRTSRAMGVMQHQSSVQEPERHTNGSVAWLWLSLLEARATRA